MHVGGEAAITAAHLSVNPGTRADGHVHMGAGTEGGELRYSIATCYLFLLKPTHNAISPDIYHRFLPWNNGSVGISSFT